MHDWKGSSCVRAGLFLLEHTCVTLSERIACRCVCASVCMYLYALDAADWQCGRFCLWFADVNSLPNDWNKVKIAPDSLYPFTASAMEPN